MAFELPPLPYPYNALEPHIDEQTMRIHHDKHHGTYVTNLNKALESAASLATKTIEDLLSNLDAVPENIRMAVRNNGGGHYNHTMFWEIMKPGGGALGGGLASAITSTFGSLDKLKEANQCGGCRAVRQRLGVARHRQGRQAGCNKHAEPGCPALGRTTAGPRR